MSNHDDFWTTLAAGHTNTVLAGAMDSHLSGKSLDESFGSVRTLTDAHRQANALSLPVEAGTKVVFAGGMGSYLSYDDVPADGATGEVVTVKSATGEITHHDGRVFVKWDDGQLRTIHAEHLRLAGQGKQAAVPRKKMENDIAGKMPPDSKKGRGANRVIMLTGDSAKVIGKDNYSRHKMSDLSDDEITTLYNFLVLGKKASTKTASPLPQPGDVFEAASNYLDIAGMGQYDESMIMRFFVQPDGSASVMKGNQPMTHKGGQLTAKAVESLFRRGGSRGLGVNTSLSDPKIVRRGKQASVIRVASLGDLTQFLKRADGKLVHKSTNDLWSYSKDADGNFLVERLFDDNGEPLQG